VLALAGALVASLLVFAAPGSAETAGEILFVTGRDSNSEIYVMNADGSAQTNLTNDPASDSDPAGSPDGAKIAFTRDLDPDNSVNREVNLEIFLMNADGSGQTNLTNNPAHDSAPAWSPDGSKIAFVSDRDGNHGLYVMNADGTGVTRVTNQVDNYPDWSPDGSQIVFHRNTGNNHDLYVVNADGTGERRLTRKAASEGSPAWSPDGTQIAFDVSSVGANNFEIYVMNADGKGATNLTNNPETFDSSSDWSPDGTRIVFSRNSDLWVMNPDGGGQTKLANLADHPNWQPLQGPPLPTTTTTAAPPQECQVDFAPATSYPTGAFNPWQVVVADLNGDGVDDLAMATPVGAHPSFNSGGEVVGMLGTGGGTFG
jgi:TolB protein